MDYGKRLELKHINILDKEVLELPYLFIILNTETQHKMHGFGLTVFCRIHVQLFSNNGSRSDSVWLKLSVGEV